ncbi:hypothetical protein WN944_024462 [Citrus x changshan-huyou]|uniref:Uncharacterized protein n=1 Tax=Citrus x changshan-huyou TaxID=2935761 RepID=A0AAP0QCM7_9ROSI
MWKLRTQLADQAMESGPCISCPFQWTLLVKSSEALREAMCFLMDRTLGKSVCYIQFRKRFDGIGKNDRSISLPAFVTYSLLFSFLAGIRTNFFLTSKASDEDGDFVEPSMFKWTALLVPTTTLIIIINLVGVTAGVSSAINNDHQSWGPFFGMLFLAFWVIVHLHPFLKGLMG